MNTSWLCQNQTRSRRRYTRFGVPRYVVSNANDDHAAPDREDYSVGTTGTTPPEEGFENTEQTASCDEGYSGDDVVIAAGQYGAATQEAADALALAAAEDGLVCELIQNPPVNFFLTVQPTTQSGETYAVASLGGGRVLAGGTHNNVDGISQPKLARGDASNPTTLDSTFAPTIDSAVFCILVHDGYYYIAGQFSTVNGSTRNKLARFVASTGALDSSWNPNIGGGTVVTCIRVLSSGKLLIGGDFTTVGGAAQALLAILNIDGTLDTSFAPSLSGFGAKVSTIAQLTNGDIVAGGNFTSPIGRLAVFSLSDGSHVSGFNLSVNGSAVQSLLVSGGYVVFGGAFTSAGGSTRRRIARCTEAGVLDASWDPAAFEDGFFTPQVMALCRLADGRLAIGGSLYEINDGSTTAKGMTIVSWVTGLKDPAFTSGWSLGGDSEPIYSIVQEFSGQLIVGGQFEEVNGVPHWGFARIELDGSEPT